MEINYPWTSRYNHTNVHSKPNDSNKYADVKNSISTNYTLLLKQYNTDYFILCYYYVTRKLIQL